jgi:hypothetical protein
MIPNIISFSPTTAAPGQKVTIHGTGFTGATAVKFGGIDSLVYFVIDDTKIEAYPNISGTGTVSVTNISGTDTQAGFTQTQVRVKITDLQQLNRVTNDNDIVYVFDSIRSILCQSPVTNLPAGTGGGGGGNVGTLLGSPFKVRAGDDNYSYDSGTNKVTITDLRLLGKTDYVVSATDVSNEFENDRLLYNEVAGSVTISDYQLTAGSHITIYADGVVSTALQTYILSIKDKITTYDKVLKPVLTLGGVCWPWRKPAIDIPPGWQEVTDFRGKVLIGQDPADVYDATTNPYGLNRANGTATGSRVGPAIAAANMVKFALKLFGGATKTGNIVPDPDGTKVASWSTNHENGNQDYDIKGTVDTEPTIGRTSHYGSDTPTGIPLPPPVGVIVNWIEYVG